MDMPGDIRSAMESAKAPEGVDAATEARIEGAIDESFVAGFRAVMLASAGLALASTLVAALLVGDQRVPSASGDPIRRTGAEVQVPVSQTAPREEGETRERRVPQPVTVGAS